jgi:predicted GIY-YIG superfamily endonuclease
VSDEFKKTYDLSVSKYLGIYKPVNVVCRKHGLFSVKPAHIYRNVGCQKCSSSGFKIDMPAFLYVLKSENNTVKVGITNRTPEARARRISVSSGFKHEVVHFVRFDLGESALKTETKLLNKLRSLYKNPSETYDGYSESFSDAEVADVINELDLLLGVEL